MPSISWRRVGDQQWAGEVKRTKGHYVITFVREENDVFVGDKKMSTKVQEYYELEANGEVDPRPFKDASEALKAAHAIERNRK